MKTVNILGTEYQLVISDSVTDKNLKNADGYCDHSVKKCVIDTLEPELDSLEDLQMRKRHVIRHELIHAFLFESGLGADSWAANEEIVDWMAAQIPKMVAVFREVDAL